jgi:hypothetical protein
MDQKSQNKLELFQKVALIQLQTRAAGVLKGSVDGVVVCPKFISDCMTITEALLNSSEAFALGKLTTDKESKNEQITPEAK